MVIFSRDYQKIRALLAANLCMVRFQKADGIETWMIATLNPDNIPELKRSEIPTTVNSNSLSDPKPKVVYDRSKQIRFWSPDRNGWRSFVINRLLYIETLDTEYRALEVWNIIVNGVMQWQAKNYFLAYD